MKKTIVAISGSPSKGRNSDTMLDAFITGIKEVEGVDVQKIYTADINCEYYRFENKDGAQKNEEELQKLFDSIETAHGLVIASPTYNFSVPAGLKNIIDRMRPIALDMQNINIFKQPKGKLSYLKTYFIVSGGTPHYLQKILFVLFPPFWLSAVFKYYGARLGGSTYGGNFKEQNLAMNNEGLMRRIQKKGKKYAKRLRNGKI